MATKKTTTKPASAKTKAAKPKSASTVKKKAAAKTKTVTKTVKAKPSANAKTIVPRKTAGKTKVKAKVLSKTKTPAKTKSPLKKTVAVAKAAAETPVKNKAKAVDHEAYLLAKTIVKGILEKKGDNLVCLDLRNIENRVCDYFIICDGNSSTQIDAIAGSVEFTVKKELGERPYRSEGWENALWILIDYVNVVVHVFDRETRQFYNLESLWADAEQITFKV